MARKKSKLTTISKRIKVEASRPSNLQTTRSSTRVKQKNIQPKCVKTPVILLKRLKPRSKKSTPRSNFSSDIKPKPDEDMDCVPKTENDDIELFELSSDIKVKRKSNYIPSPKCIPCHSPLCTVTFRSIRARDAHAKLAHEGLSPYQCQICKIKCRRENDLGAHMVIMHEKGEKKFPCIKCVKSFCLEENLERHLKLHDVEDTKPLVCDVCDSRFENEEKLNRHEEIHKVRFRCQHCAKKCKDRKELER